MIMQGLPKMWCTRAPLWQVWWFKQNAPQRGKNKLLQKLSITDDKIGASLFGSFIRWRGRTLARNSAAAPGARNKWTSHWIKASLSNPTAGALYLIRSPALPPRKRKFLVTQEHGRRITLFNSQNSNRDLPWKPTPRASTTLTSRT